MQNIKQISLLCQKSVKNINSKNIGWIRPDGIINFTTKDAAKTYAINRCKSANKLHNKKEIGVVVKDNMVLSETIGKSMQVEMDFSKLSKYRGCDLYHNHPMPIPLSMEDYGTLVCNKCLKTITAVDIINKFYTMTKLPYKKIKYLPQKISDFVGRLIFDRLNLFKADKKYQNIMDNYKNILIELNKEFDTKASHLSIEELKKLPLMKTIKDTYIKLSIDIDKMWCENAESLGVKYKHGKV